MDPTTTAAENADATLARLRLEFWRLDRLIPSPRNARTHSEAQVAEIAGSIRAFGFSNPVLVGAEGDVVAGHGRLAAARLLGALPCLPLYESRSGRSIAAIALLASSFCVLS
jgi:hypothetical protein